MRRKWPRPLLIAIRLVLIAAAWMAGQLLGSAIPAARLATQRADVFSFLAEPSPLPHHVPKDPGGLSFRFAMVNDVIHERFARHGRDYYERRDRSRRDELARLDGNDPGRFPLLDDIAVDQERLGKSEEAASLIRDKMAEQQAMGLKGKDLYTSYANLGTFLIHASFPRAMDGDEAALKSLEEGIGFIRKSVEVNPEAHFGRETWQAAIAEFLAAAIRKPELLKTFDCLGNRLDLPMGDILDRELNWIGTAYGRPYDAAFSQGKTPEGLRARWNPSVDLDAARSWPILREIRRHVTRIGAEEGWEAVPVTSHREPVPFDEPMLGIIGMWRQGGGANPHFALAIGETMLRVGQRYLAWAAFERAFRLADRYSRDPATQQFFRDHCRGRQQDIERSLLKPEGPDASASFAYHVPRTLTPDGIAGLRTAFEAELSLGTTFQRALQEYEAEQIAAGSTADGETLIADFERGKAPIATPPGGEESYWSVSSDARREFTAERMRASGFFGGCLFASIALLATSRRGSRRAAETRPLPRQGRE
ncbi:hypothetical protein [Aquisphaera insulae]|uniref:hypothetical protein n=1 Tax=Aquisphaera insulae TaxID=2712864 RepID=UPI0013EC5896|nr:hypothetical protein [Aquisphaera insulae]